jgi:hypothetical protein
LLKFDYAEKIKIINNKNNKNKNGGRVNTE